MSGSEFEITPEGWQRLSETERSWILYDTFLKHREACDRRFCRLERRKWLDKGLAIASGIAAGIASAIGLKQ